MRAQTARFGQIGGPGRHRRGVGAEPARVPGTQQRATRQRQSGPNARENQTLVEHQVRVGVNTIPAASGAARRIRWRGIEPLVRSVD